MARQLSVGSLVFLLILMPSLTAYGADLVPKASHAVQEHATSPVETNLDALPQITPEVAAMHPVTSLFGPGIDAAEYASRKSAANTLSRSMAPHVPGVQTPASAVSGAAQTPVGSGFWALGYGCSGYYPPDQGLAVNQSYVFEMVNACVAVYDKAGNLQAGFPKSLNAFFGLPATAFTFDPRVLYDWLNNRFIAIASRYGSSIAPQILVAVSKTSNPLGGWYIYNLKGAAGTGVGDLADFPEVGQDRLAFYISFNYFQSAANFIDARVMILPKGQMYAGSSLSYEYWYGLNVGGTAVDSVEPANEFSPSDKPRAEFLVNSFNGNFGGGQCSTSACNGLVVWAISNPLAHGGATFSELSGFVVGTANNYSLPPAASQIGCNNCIDTGDVRISGGVTYHAGSVFGSLNTASASAPGSHVLWFEIKPTLSDNGSSCGSTNLCPDINGAAIANEDCYLCGYSGDWYYATLQPDLENNVTMVFHYSLAGSEPPSVAYTSRRVTQTPNTMHDSGVYLVNPIADYIVGAAPRRWGDYSATAPDLSGPSSQVWFAGEFSNPAGVWRTAIGHNSFNRIADP